MKVPHGILEGLVLDLTYEDTIMLLKATYGLVQTSRKLFKICIYNAICSGI